MKFLLTLLWVVVAATAPAQIVSIDFDPGDTTSYDGWENLRASDFPGYGSFPGFSPWPGPIGSNAASSGDATLRRVAGSAGGGPFVATSTIYFGSFTAVPNTLGGTLGLADISVLSGANTIVLQIQIGEATGFDFFNAAVPTLMVNGTTPIGLTFSGLINQFQDGLFLNPETNIDEPVFVNTWGFQWDVSGFGGPITALDLQFSGVQHSQVYALQLDQSTGQYDLSLVPEPTTGILLGFGGMALVLTTRCRRRRVLFRDDERGIRP